MSQRIEVGCFSPAGIAADTRFALTFTNDRTAASTGRLVAPLASTVGFYAAGASSYNSTGATNRLYRSGVGTYEVTMPGLARYGGNVQVTATGDGNRRCQPYSWARAGSDEVVSIRCFAPGGQPADSGYAVTFQDQTIGSWTGGYLLIDQGGLSGTYAPNPRYLWTTGAAMTVTKRPEVAGAYTVSLPPGGYVAHAQVVAVRSSRRCVVTGWTATQADVRCYTDATTPVAADAMVSVLVIHEFPVE